MERYDLLVVGGGLCGLAAAKQAADLGAKVVVAEPGPLGGTCINRGGVPKKALVRSATVYRLALDAGRFGVATGPVTANWKMALERMDELVRLLQRNEAAALQDRDVAWISGKASFLSPHQLVVGDRQVQTEHVILAAGSRPWLPKVPGLDSAITSDQFFESRELPRDALIVGGGVIALEFAHIWNAFGVKVTLLEIGDRILAGIDAELAEQVARISADRGIDIISEARVTSVSRDGDRLSVEAFVLDSAVKYAVDTVLVAAGRVPVTDGMMLDAAGVRVQNGRIATNEYLQTAASHIYAAGDAIGGHSLATVATYEGRLAARNALRGNVEKLDLRLVPTTVFTLPPLSTVGLSETQGRETAAGVQVTRLPFDAVEGALVHGDTDGMIKIISEAGSGRILGTHILGARSEELIHEFAIAMRANMSLPQLGEVIPIHPSFSEGAIGAALTSGSGRVQSYCG